jgi:plasmid replication initiation protein
MPLVKEHHKQRDFFIADIFDGLPFKNDMASMEYPFFTLSKKKDMRNLIYKNGNASIEIKPTTDGLPTIFDKDILLYCMSLLMREINAGRTPPKTLRVSVHDLLVATNRSINGNNYVLLKQALDRLKGVSVKTTVKTNRIEQVEAFGFLDSYRIIESSRVKDRMVRLEITLSEWIYNSVVGKEILTISRDYFRLGKPLERRIYELARKHCGTQQKQWHVSLQTLLEKTGSTSPLRKFRLFIKNIALENHLPDYEITFSRDEDKITFAPRKTVSAIAKKQKRDVEFSKSDNPISFKVLDKARDIVMDAGTGWDFYGLVEEFKYSLQTGYKPKNVDGAFIAFIKKKVARCP